MQLVNLNSETLPAGVLDSIRQAVTDIEQGNKAQSAGKKQAESGKNYLAAQLLALRKIEVNKLPIGEVVSVSVAVKPGERLPLFNVTIGSQNRIDLDTFKTEQAEISAKYHKDFPTVSYRRAI